MKKRIAALVLCLALVFALAACGEAAPATESAGGERKYQCQAQYQRGYSLFHL